MLNEYHSCSAKQDRKSKEWIIDGKNTITTPFAVGKSGTVGIVELGYKKCYHPN